VVAVPQDGFATYAAELRAIPLLTPAQEGALTAALAAGRAPDADAATRARAEAAREQLVSANLRLVLARAGRFSGRGLGWEDLVAEGNFGLLRACDSFDPGRGVRFCTYAVWWIDQRLQRAIDDQSRLIRLPVHTHEAVRRVRGAAAALTQDLGRAPTAAEIAAATGQDAATVRAVEQWMAPVASLDRPLDADSDTPFGALLADPGAPDPEAGGLRAGLAVQVAALLDTLPAREAYVLRRRFGLGGCVRAGCLQEIGDELGVTRERVRQMEGRALALLREQAGPALRDWVESAPGAPPCSAKQASLPRRTPRPPQRVWTCGDCGAPCSPYARRCWTCAQAARVRSFTARHGGAPVALTTSLDERTDAMARSNGHVAYDTLVAPDPPPAPIDPDPPPAPAPPRARKPPGARPPRPHTLDQLFADLATLRTQRTALDQQIAQLEAEMVTRLQDSLTADDWQRLLPVVRGAQAEG
jgi:RNA polymerase primary sigma factor